MTSLTHRQKGEIQPHTQWWDARSGTQWLLASVTHFKEGLQVAASERRQELSPDPVSGLPLLSKGHGFGKARGAVIKVNVEE